jgi:hypothetical protein
MSYSSLLPDFPRTLIVYGANQWFSASDLAQLAQKLASVYFPIGDQRNLGFSLLTSVNAPAPFSFDPPVRFPATGIYASDVDASLSKLLSQLRLATSFKDKLQQTSSLGVSDRAISSLSSEYLAALNTFTTALSDLFAYCVDPANFYDRLTFETSLSLSWS